MNKEDEVIFIFTMGKVASSTIFVSLKEVYNSVYHIHRLNLDNIEKIKQYHLSNGLKQPGCDIVSSNLIKNNIKPTKIITLVREPISRNMSAYFENYKIFDDKLNDIRKSIERFTKNYHHKTPLNWFDSELKKSLDFDIFSNEFDKKNGYQTYSFEDIEYLVMKVELEDKIKQKALSKFLNNDINLINSNLSEEKGYIEFYKKFKDSIIFDEKYVDTMYNSKYMKHFYTEKEIEGFKKKWLKH